jgi:hypothetical protein
MQAGSSCDSPIDVSQSCIKFGDFLHLAYGVREQQLSARPLVVPHPMAVLQPVKVHDHNDMEATGDGHRQDLKMGMAHANSE